MREKKREKTECRRKEEMEGEVESEQVKEKETTKGLWLCV